MCSYLRAYSSLHRILPSSPLPIPLCTDERFEPFLDLLSPRSLRSRSSILEKGIDRINRINYLWIIASLEMNEVFKIDFQRKIREEIDRENFEMKVIVVL